MKRNSIVICTSLLVLSGSAILSQTPPAQAPGAQAPPAGRGGAGRGAAPPASIRKHVLVFGLAKGFHHDSISNAMATVWKLGKESGVWDTEISTDPNMIRKPEKPGGGFTP